MTPTSRFRSISRRLHAGWISDSEYLGEISLLCDKVRVLFFCYYLCCSVFILCLLICFMKNKYVNMGCIGF